MKLLPTILSISLLFIIAHTQIVNQPIIGIIAIPSEFDEYPSTSYSYFAASYVKYLETGGAQVVPIPYDLPQQNITFLLDRLNGVFFTGGGTPLVNPDGSLTPIGQTLNFTVYYVLDQNKKGNYYPLWGTCMGFQAIASLIQQSFSILTPDCVGCHGVNKNNVFRDGYQSRLYSQLPADLAESMMHNNISVFVHNSMLHVTTFMNSVPLNQYLTPTTFSFDQNGQEYVSSYESPTLPIYGTQYHQEKNNFEFRAPYPINHCPDCTRLQQYLAKFFVNETKKNNNTFPEQQQYLVENYEPTVLLDSSYNLIYFFPASKSTAEDKDTRSYNFLEKNLDILS